MPTDRPHIIMVAGPNGAGKTSFARQLLPKLVGDYLVLNSDEIAREAAFSNDLAAAREMLIRLDKYTGQRRNILVETTLASRMYANKISHWRTLGYAVAVVYLRLPSVEASISRVQRRVAEGGHNVPEAALRRRFGKSLSYLHLIYKPIVDEWYVLESLDGHFELVEAWDQP